MNHKPLNIINKPVKRLWRWCTKTRRRKILSATLAVLMLLTSIRFIFIKPTPVSASDVFIKFDEGYGTSLAVNDSNGTVSPGSITNAVWRTEDMCKVGKCLYFDGTGDYVSFPDHDSLDMTAADEVTISLWFRTGNISSGTRTLISKYETTGADGGYQIYMNSQGQIVFGIDNDNSGFPLYSATSPGSYDDNRWHFISAVKNGTASMSLYIDAVHTATTSIASTNAANDDTFYIGINNALGNGWLGFIDEVKIMRSVRTADEVKTDYAGQTSERGTAAAFGPDNSWLSDGLVGWWKMDHTSGNATDYSGNNQTLTNNNSISYSPGKFGNSAHFNRSNSNYFHKLGVEGLIVDSVSTRTGSGNGSETISHTTSGSNRLMLVGISHQNGNVTGVAYNGDSLTELVDNTNSNLHSIIYYRLSPDTGTNNLVVDFGGSPTAYTIGVATFYQVNQSTPFGTYQTNTGSSTSASVNLSSNADQVVFDVVATGDTTSLSVGADQNELWNLISGTRRGGGSVENGAPTTTMSWSLGSSADWAISAVPIIPGPLQSPDSLNISNQVTLSTWINPSSNASSTQYNIMGKWDSGKEQFLLSQYGNQLRLHIGGNSNYIETTNANLTTGTWHHVTATYNSATQTGNIYLNGQTLTTNINGTLPTSIPMDDSRFHIGSANSRSSADNFFDGYLQDARIYSRILSPAEAQKLYNWAPGPVGYWKMDEGTGTTAYDSSGNNNHGTLNTPLWTQGKFGSAFGKTRVNGINERVTVTNPPTGVLDFNDTDFSIGGWIKIDESESVYEIVRKWSTDGGFFYGYILGYGEGGGAGSVSCSYSDGRSSGFDEVEVLGANLNDGKWHHVMCVRDKDGFEIGTAGLHIYIDGIWRNYDSSLITGSGANSENLYFGEYNDESDNAILDDIKIYNYARTPAQIIEDMNAGHPAPGSPVGSATLHWKFNEGYGTTANNSGNGGSSLNGTITGATWSSSGRSGKAINVDNASRTISAGDVAFTDGLTQMTISLWVNPTTLTASRCVIGKWPSSNTSNSFRICALASSSDELRLSIASSLTDSTNYFETTNLDLAQSAWQHLVFVYDGTESASNRVKIYKDGRAVSGSVTGTIPASMTTGSTSSLILGDVTGQTAALVTLYDDVKIYNLAMTAEQVKTEYNQGGATVFGAAKDADGNVSYSSASQYCIPGDTSACDAPVAEWKFDENTGGYAYDTSGNGNTGTLTNGPTWVTGKSSSALSFDGASGLAQDDYVNAGSGSTIDDIFDGGGTASFWVNPASPGELNTARILMKSGANTGWMINVQPCDSNFVDITLQTSYVGQDALWRVDCSLNRNQWNHVAVSWNDDNASNDPSFFINGIQKTLDLDTNPDGYTSDANENLIIGNSPQGSGTFDGMIDSVRMYNYARTPAQIAWEYNRGGPVGWWKMNENVSGNNQTIYDSSGFGNNGTTNWGANSSGMDCTVAGKQGKACDFDGVDDYITVPDNSIYHLDDTDDFTGMLWVYSDSWGGTNRGLLGKRTSYTTQDWNLAYLSVDEIRLYLGESNADNVFGSDDVSLSTGAWHHVAFTKEGDTYKLYVNGVLKSTDTSSQTWTDSDNLVFGNDPGEEFALDGKIDDVRIYNYVLTPEQIRSAMNAGGAVKFGP